MKSDYRGFTLLEIIVVMMIISISGSLVFMNFGRGADKREIKIFAEKMTSLCRRAGMAALASGVPAAFVISSIDRQCWISMAADRVESPSGQGDDEKSQGEIKKAVLVIPEKILIEAKGLAEKDNGLYEIFFYPDGSSSGGDIAIREGSENAFFCRIDMLTGVVSITKDDPDIDSPYK